MTVLGLDIGTTATKWAEVDTSGALVNCGVLQGEVASFSQAYDAIGITGVGADKVQDVNGILVGEFAAIAKGGRTLSGLEEAVVVSVGTGTAFLHAKADGTFDHLCGTGIGGGTIAGLSQVLSGATSSAQVAQLSQQGDFTQVDLTMAEVTDQLPPGLLPHMTAANFARIAPQASPADFVSGAVNLVLHAVGTMALMGCKLCGCKQVVLVGGTTQLPPVAEVCALFASCYGVGYQVPEQAQYATAYGAALIALETREV